MNGRNAGQFKCMAVIEQCTGMGKNAENLPEQIWEEYYRNYVYANKLSGSVFWEAARNAAQETVQFEFRWHSALDSVKANSEKIGGFRLKAYINGTEHIYHITNVDNIQYANVKVVISGIESE